VRQDLHQSPYLPPGLVRISNAVLNPRYGRFVITSIFHKIEKLKEAKNCAIIGRTYILFFRILCSVVKLLKILGFFLSGEKKVTVSLTFDRIADTHD
jgi:hypothetical protein